MAQRSGFASLKKKHVDQDSHVASSLISQSFFFEEIGEGTLFCVISFFFFNEKINIFRLM